MAHRDDSPARDDVRSPSPPVAPPTPSHPGVRSSALQRLYSDAIAHILQKNSYSNFAACFPTPARHVASSLAILHADFNAKLDKSMSIHFDTILAERNVVPSLNDWDRLVEHAKRRRRSAQEQGDVAAPLPAHTLPAKQLYHSHLAPSLSQHVDDLRSRQGAVQTENRELLDRVTQQRKDIAALMHGLENVVADLDATVAALQPSEITGCTKDTRDVDEEMTMTAG